MDECIQIKTLLWKWSQPEFPALKEGNKIRKDNIREYSGVRNSHREGLDHKQGMQAWLELSEV